MNNSFSLRRVGLLARKHYAENRRSYRYILLSTLLVVALLVWATAADRDDMAFHIAFTLVPIIFPIIFATLSMRCYCRRGERLAACMLPASQTEKFIFVFLNTLLTSFAAYALVESIGSLAIDIIGIERIAGNKYIADWFSAIDNILPVGLFMIAVGMLACTIGRRPVVGYLTVLVVYLVVGALPVVGGLLFGADISTLRLPILLTDFRIVVSAGDVAMNFDVPFTNVGIWNSSILSALIMLVAAFFRFRERQMR